MCLPSIVEAGHWGAKWVAVSKKRNTAHQGRNNPVPNYILSSSQDHGIPGPCQCSRRPCLPKRQNQEFLMWWVWSWHRGPCMVGHKGPLHGRQCPAELASEKDLDTYQGRFSPQSLQGARIPAEPGPRWAHRGWAGWDHSRASCGAWLLCRWHLGMALCSTHRTSHSSCQGFLRGGRKKKAGHQKTQLSFVAKCVRHRSTALKVGDGCLNKPLQVR